MKQQTILKSMLCLLMALVCNVAWAQTATIESSTDVDAPRCVYRIKSKNGYWMTSCTSLGAETNSGLFAFFKVTGVPGYPDEYPPRPEYENAYKIYSVERQKWVSYSEATEYTNGPNKVILVDTRAEANVWEVTQSGDYYLFAPYLSSNVTVAGFYWNWHGGIGSNPSNNVTTTVGFYNSNSDGGSLWTLSEVEDFDFTQIVDLNGTFTDQIGQEYSCTYKGIPGKTKPIALGSGVASISNEVWNGNSYTANITFPFTPSSTDVTNHVVISPYNGFDKKYYASGTDVKSNNGMNTSLPTDVKNYLWAFYPTFTDDGFKVKIKNIGTGMYIFSDPTAESHGANDVSLKAVGEASSFTIIGGNQIINESGKYLSVPSSGSGQKDVGNYHKDHNGTKNKFVDANNYTLTLSDESTYSGTNGVHNVQGGNYTYTDGVWNENGYSAKVDFNFTSLPFPVSTVGAEDWTFIRCYMSGLETYFYTNGDNVKTKSSDSRNNNLYLPTNSVEAVNKYQWAIYYPTLTAGKFAFKIKNRATGKYVTGTGAGDATVADTGADFCWGTCMGSGSGFYLANNTNVFFAGNSSSQGEQKAILWNKSGDTHMGGNLSFTKEAYSITFDAAGYTTLYTPSAVTIPNGVTAYTAKLNDSNTVLVLNEVGGATIPAQTAVVLKGTASTTYVFSAADDVNPIEGNVLRGTSANINVSDVEGYVYTHAGNSVFTKVTEGSITGYNAYLVSENSESNILLPLSNTSTYKVYGERGFIYATEGETPVLKGTNVANVTYNAEDPYHHFAIIEEGGNYYLYNVGAKKFVVKNGNNTSLSDNPAHQTFTMDAATNLSTAHDLTLSLDGTWMHLSQAGSNGVYVSNSTQDGGTRWSISEVTTDFDPKDALYIIRNYNRQLPVRAEVEGSWADNPNTHFGSVRATASTGTLTSKLKTTPSVAIVDYDGLNETTIDFTREYRGFEFQGYSHGGVDLGKSFTLTDALKSSITEANPLVAKFTATDDVTIWYDDDPFSYRIPAIAKTSTGRLIAVSDYRYSLDDIGRYNFGTANPGIDLVIRMSDDNGKTWGATKTIAKGSCVRNTNDCAYGDAAIAVVGQKVLVMGAAGDVMFGNGSATAHNRTVRIFSEDNGVTWTAPQDISETFFINDDATINSAYSLFFGSGKLAVDENYNGTGKARIYGAVLVRKNGIGNGIYVVYTDDFGISWSILGGSQTHITANDEPKVEILPSGQILLSVRRGGGRQFNVFTYTDKANNAGSWNSNQNGCNNGGDNTCNGEIFLVDAKNALGEDVKLLLQSQPKGGSGLYDRRDVTIWYKEVDNTSYTSSQIAGNWIEGMQVSTQQSAYSTMSLQEDGKIAFFFEEAPCYGDDQAKGYCMVYTPLTIEEITKNKYFSLDADFSTEVTINVELTDAQGNKYRDQLQCALPDVVTTLTTKYPFITLGNEAKLSAQNGAYSYTNKVSFPFVVSTTSGTTAWYNIYFPSNTNNNFYPVYMAAGSDNAIVKAVTESTAYGNSSYNTQSNEGMISWAIYQSAEGAFSFVLKNKKRQQYLRVLGNLSGNTATTNVQFTGNISDASAFVPSTENRQNAFRGEYSLKVGNGYIVVGSVNNGNVTWSTNKNHQGGWVKFVEAPYFTQLLNEVNATLDMIGTGLGQYKVTDANAATAETAKEAMQNSATVKLNDLNTYKGLLNGATLNIPKAGQYFRIKGISGNYIDASSLYNASTGQMSMKSAAACNYKGTIFYLDEEKHLVNYATGTCIKETSEIGAVGAAAGVWTFAESPRTGKGKYALSCTTTNNNGRHLHDNSGNRADRCSNICGNRHDFTLEEVTELPVTIGSTGFGTLYAPVALTLPEGMKAYTGTLSVEEGENVLTLSAVEEFIPARTGVILQADKADYEFEITTADAFLANDLKGSVVSFVHNNSGYQPYTLQTSTNSPGVAFKRFIGSSITGGKVYLELPTTQAAAAVRVRFAGTTEIEMPIANGQQPTAVYDLAGRRVENPTKGIYIVNGKKVVIK